MELEAIFGIEYVRALMNFVYSSFSLRGSACSCSGIATAFAIGVLVTTSKTLSLNTKSSAKCELVGTGDHFPALVQAHLFLGVQNFPLTSDFFFQEN